MTHDNTPETPLIGRFRARLAEAAAGGAAIDQAEAGELFAAYEKLDRRLGRIARISDNYQGEVKRLVLELQDALANVKTLKGFIPICASCKKIRNDEGYWKQLEQYVSEHSEALFSHGLCPDCIKNYYPTVVAWSPEQGPPPPRAILDEADLQDPAIVEALPIVNNKSFARTPLYEDYKRLFQKYVRLTKRMKRIVRISDQYQSQLKITDQSVPPGEALFGSFFAVAPWPWAVVSPEGAIVSLGERFSPAFGYTIDEVGRIEDWWRLACPDAARRRELAAAWDAAVQKARADRMAIELGACAVTCKSGEVRTVRITGVLRGDYALVAFLEVA